MSNNYYTLPLHAQQYEIINNVDTREYMYILKDYVGIQKMYCFELMFSVILKTLLCYMMYILFQKLLSGKSASIILSLI